MDGTRLRVVTRMAWGGLLLATLACGGDEATPGPSGRPMAPTAAPEAREGTNQAPEISRLAISPGDPVPGAVLQAVADASDPDGDAIRLEYRWFVNGEEVASGPSANVKLDIAKGDRVEVEAVASDGRAQSQPRRRSVSVGNRPPTLKGVALAPSGDVRAGDTLTVQPVADDPDGDAVEFRVRWLVNGQQAGEGLSFATDDLTRGDRVVAEVVAADRGSETRPVRSELVEIGNTPPRITALPSRRVDEGTFVYDFEAEDPDGDRNLRFWLDQAPDGMRIDAISGQMRWTPREDQIGTHPVEVGVKDGSGEGTTFVFEVTVTAQGGEATPPPADSGV